MYHPDDLHKILLALSSQDWNAVIVGGQAINMLACAYANPTKERWKILIPFTSEDLDFLGGPVEVAILKKSLPGKCKVNKSFDPSPNAGVMLTPLQGKNLRIDILTYILGVDSAEAEESALNLTLAHETQPIKVRVLHPVLCLTAKAHCLRHLSQTNRQDHKQLQMAVLTLNGYLTQRIDQPRPVLNLIKRICATAQTEEGLYAESVGIRLEESIPIKEISERKEEQYRKFAEMEWPRAMARLEEKRAKRKNALEKLRSQRGRNEPSIV